jgi:hypothetical protein
MPMSVNAHARGEVNPAATGNASSNNSAASI